MDEIEIIEREELEVMKAFDQKEQFKEEIKKYLKDAVRIGNSLDKIKQSIFKKFHNNSLNSIDENYIEYKYIKYCLREFLNELPIFLNEITQNDLKTLIENVTKIKTIENISSPFSQSKYLKLIIENINLLSKDDCDVILIQFKQNIANYLKENFSPIEEQIELFIEFQKALKEFLSIYEIHQFPDKMTPTTYIPDFYKEQIKLFTLQFLANDIRHNLLDSVTITERSQLTSKKFQQTINDLNKINEIKLTNYYFEQIVQIIKYSLTPIKYQINIIDTRNILQINGVYISLNYILSKLEQELIQSNIVEVYLIVLETLFIDCDLQNNIWHGKNIAIHAKRIIVIENRTIDVSGLNSEPKTKPLKAENGKQGQTEEDKNGRHGINGTKGESGGNITIIAEIIDNGNNLTITSNGGNGGFGQDGGDGANGENGLNGHGLTLDEFKQRFPPPLHPGEGEGDTFVTTRVEKNIQAIKTIPNVRIIKGNPGKDSWFIYKRYIEAETQQGNKIYFSFHGLYYPSSYERAYFLYKGGCGQPGKPGGFGGLGGFAGEPGFAGDIQISIKSYIKSIAMDGCRNLDGRTGKDGSFGVSGENKPDVGYIDRPYTLIPFRSYPIYYGPSWLKLSVYNESAADRVVDAEDTDINRTQYIAIESRKKPDPPACLSINEQAKRRHQQTKEKKQEATRKHAISNELLTELYNNYQSQFVMVNSIENFQTNIDLLQEQLSHIKLEQINIEQENIHITKSFNNKKHIKLNKFHSNDSETSSNRIQDFKLSLLEKIAQVIDNDKDCNTNIIDEFIEEDTKSDRNSAIHSILGIKNEFHIYECIDYNDIRKNIKDNINANINNNKEISKLLQISIIDLMENSTDKQKFRHMKKYVEELNFDKNVLIQCNTNKEKFLYMQKNIKDLPFNNNVLNEYGDYITKDHRSFNKYDIVLLAHLYKICLKVYLLSDNDQNLLELFATYNENSHNIVHVLYKNNKFIRLSVKKVLDRNIKCIHYAQILNDINQLVTNDELNEYFTNEKFRFNKNENKNQENIIKDDKEIIDNISSYFNMNIRQKIRLALTTLSSEFISNCNLLETLEKRFLIENPFIKYNTIALLSMSIINSNKNKDNLIIYQWIISAYPQNEWINEIALLKFEKFSEDFYKKFSYWRSILREIQSKEIIELLIIKLEKINQNQQQIDIENLILEIKNCKLKDEEFIDIFTHLELNQWSIKFKHIHFIQSVSESIQQSNSEEKSIFDKYFPTIIYYLYSLNNRNTSIVKKLLQLLKDSDFNLEEFSNIVQLFYIGTLEFTGQKASFSHIQIDNNERNLEKLINIIRNDKNTSIRIKDKLNELKTFVNNLNKYTSIQINQIIKSIKNSTIEDIKQWTIEFKSRNYKDKINSLNEVLNVIERGITSYFPEIKGFRIAQKLTIISFILNSKNFLAQVSTGEGKSLIIASIMIIKCLLGEKGDIITSSSVLAKRDANENIRLFDLFGISVAHNAYENLNQRRSAYEKQIVYGDVSSFQRDYLLDHFYGKKILGDRYENGRTNIIVDEVDSMLLDKGNSVLYLSHQPSCLDTLETVYVCIWQNIILNIINGKYPSIDKIKKIILHNLYSILDKQELIKITDDQNIIEKIWEELIDNGNIDNNGKIFSPKVEFEDKDLISFVKYVEYLLKDILSQEKQIEIPNYLKPFVERHLTTWIQSALLALNMEEGKNYIIDVDKTGTKLDKYPNIIIVDCDTGVDQTNSQWNECLHQFLQLKHQCKTSLLSLKAIFISNITFFNMYKHIYGLSGTLGSQSEREFLQLAYDVDFLIVPVALRSKFKEYQPILCTNRVEWKAKIIEKAIEICKRRSVLIICETIKDVEQIYQSFKLQNMNDFNLNNILIYKRSYEKSSIEHENLDIGKIIISTNLAGRGTNINITDQLNINGGLHVILTYLPDNYRIEQQAFGRTARKGQNGSGQLIFFDQFNSKTNEIDSLLQIIDLKNERDYNELCRVGDIRHYYETSIQFQEQLFHRFHKAYSQLKEKLERQWKISDDIKDIILKSVLNKWTFWLDEIEISMNNKIQIVQLLEPFIKQLDNIMSFEDSIKQLVTEPTQLIKLGKYYAKTKNYIQALKLFDKVIENEPEFCQAAHYYKAHCIVKHTKLLEKDDKNNFNRSLDNAELLFQNHIDKLTQRSSIIQQLSIINGKESTISFVNINSYQIQNENICRLYSNFIQTIHNIRGHSVTYDTILSIDINQELAFRIYKALFYSDKNILIKKKLNQNFDGKKLEIICRDYRLDFNHMENYLKNEEFFNEEKLRKYIEKIEIPNREQFWKLMIEKEMITNVKHLILININQRFDKNTKLKEFMDKFEKQLQPIDQLKPNDKSRIFFEEIKFDKENIKYIIKSIDDDDYQNLEEQKFILLNQMATINIDKLRNTSIGIFESITLNHFNKINDLNTDDDQQQIYDKLVEQNIINKETGTLLTDDFQKLNLGKYQIYVQHINSLIKYQCLYKLQILELIKQFDSKDFNKINLTLSHNLHQKLLYDLQSSLIIQPVYYNFKVINVSILKQVFLKDYSSELEKLIKETCDCEKQICKSVSKSLQNTIGKLNYLSQPDSYLNDIDQNFDETDKFEHTQEIDMFTINGLDHTIDIEEKKWSWQMLKNTTFIFILGFAQIAAGVVLELYSMGIGTHIASALISEGLSDISYAFFAAKSGYFNWNNYLVHKIQSVMLSIATMGIAAAITKGIRYSRFGSKVVGNTGNVKSLSGNELIKATENSRMPGVTNNLHKKFACRIGLKITEGIAFGLSSAAISLLSDKLLKGYSGQIVEELFSQIRDSMEAKKNEIQESLKIIYQRYGRHLTEKWLREIDERINSDTWYETIARITTTIVNVVVGGISEALHKMNQAGHSSTMVEIMSIFMTVYNKVKQYQPYLTAIKKVFFDTKRLIENKIKILKEKAQQCQNENQINKEEIINENDSNNFIEKTTEQWRKTLENKIDTDIRTIIIEPLLNQGTKKLLRKLGKTIRNYHQRRKNNLLWKKFQDTKNKYEKDKENLIQNQYENSVNTSDFLKELNDQYNQNLLVLMANTTDPNLVASIIDEGGPMDYSCIRAIANILNKSIKINNADGTTFPDLICPDGLDRNNIQDENCISVELIRGDGVNTFGHFVLSGQTDRNEIDNNYDNNCLIYAIAGATNNNINSSNVGEFRRQIANEIKNNPQIGDIIRNGYHRYYISQLGFGGQRESSVDQLKKASISEEDSNRYLVGVVSKHGNRKDYGTTCLSKRNVRESEHLLPRALVQRLCEVMCIRYLIEKTIDPELKGNEEEEKKLFDYFRKKIDENDKPIIKELDKFMIKSKEMLAMCIPYSAHHNAEKTWTSFKSSFPEFWKEAEGYIDAYKSMDDNQNDNLFNLLICQYDYLLNDQQYPRMRSGIAIYLELSEKRGYINRTQRIGLLSRWNLPYRISTDQSNEIPMNHQNHELLENVLNTASSMEPPKFERKRRNLAP